MQKLLILQGIPACGKTTWAKKFVLENSTYVRVSRDDLRRMRGKYWVPEQEDLITKWEHECIDIAVCSGYNVILDATNLNSKTLATIKNLVTPWVEKGVLEIEYKKFDITLEEALARDSKRGEEAVGEAVVKDFYYRYCVDTQKVPETTIVIQNPDLPHAILIDLDGTMCIHNGRGPFEYLKCDTDLLNEPVASIVQKFLGKIQIIYASGREDLCREKSENWLRVQSLFDGILFMRKTGDHRKDVIIKQEIFDREIRGKYFIEFVIDDRTQVVDFYRGLGLTVFQCAPGDF
jgi:predicted kinase